MLFRSADAKAHGLLRFLCQTIELEWLPTGSFMRLAPGRWPGLPANDANRSLWPDANLRLHSDVGAQLVLCRFDETAQIGASFPRIDDILDAEGLSRAKRR